MKKTTNAAMEMGEIRHLFIVTSVQTSKVAMEISAEILQRARNRSPTLSGYSTLGHIPIGLYIPLNIFIHVCYCSIHNNQGMEIA